MTVLVMGATGNVGAATLDALRERGTEVRAVSRTERSWPAGVTGFVGDAGDADGLKGAGEGVTGAFLMSGYAAEAALLEELAGAHVVLLSSSSAPVRGPSGNAMAAYHLESEQAVKAAAARWTILRPCSFQANVLRWDIQGDTVRAPFADVPVAMIDPADIGAVAAAALTESGHDGAEHRLSGPQALTPPEQVEVVAEATGRPLRFEAVPDDVARAEFEDAMPAPYVDATFDIFRGEHVAELESAVTPTVEQVLGRPAGTLAAWAERNAARL